MGLRGEQGTLFCPWQACSGVPLGFSMGHGDTHHPKASLPAGGIGLSPEEWAQIVLGTWQPVTIFSLSFSISLWVGTPEDQPAFWRGAEAAFRSHLFSRGFLLCLSQGLGAVVEPQGPSPFPPSHVAVLVLQVQPGV